MHTYNTLVIGAGYAGAITARELAERAGQKVLVLERRDHMGGNAYDCPDRAGVLVHRYGPHIFHTAHKRVFDYLSRFTQWRNYQHRVLASVHGVLMPVPFNLRSLNLAFEEAKAARLCQKLLLTYGAEKKVTILDLRQNPDPEVRELAEYVYENVFLHYTIKQWGQKPEEIDPGTIARVPVFLSLDDRYFQDPWQGMPQEGYTSMFQAILDHPNITVELGVDARDRMSLEDGQVLLDGVVFKGHVIYTGPLDELFDCRFDRLPYRTLDFAFETLPQDSFQPTGTVNYTTSEDYTRITEFKHLTGQVLEGATTIVKEYSRAYTGEDGETPYYAVISPENNALYLRYRALAEAFPQLSLLGRLAEYQYYNMDAIALRALELADTLIAAPKT